MNQIETLNTIEYSSINNHNNLNSKIDCLILVDRSKKNFVIYKSF